MTRFSVVIIHKNLISEVLNKKINYLRYSQSDSGPPPTPPHYLKITTQTRMLPMIPVTAMARYAIVRGHNTADSILKQFM